MSLQINKNLNILIVSLILLASLAVVAIAFNTIREENKHSNLFNSHLQGLDELSQFNSKWVAALDKTKGLTLIDFDEIAHYTKEIRSKIAHLDSAGLLDDSLVGEETTSEYQHFKNMFEVKYEAIQRYKSEKAVLRNSANFLESSSNEALQHLRSQRVKKDIKQTTSSLLNYLLLNISYWEEKSKSHFPYLESQDIQLETSMGKEKLATYSKHAKIILEYSPRVIDMLERAKKVDIYTLTKNISNTFLSRQTNSEDIVNYWKKLLIGAAVPAILAFLWLLSLLWKKPKRLQATQQTA